MLGSIVMTQARIATARRADSKATLPSHGAQIGPRGDSFRRGSTAKNLINDLSRIVWRGGQVRPFAAAQAEFKSARSVPF